MRRSLTMEPDVKGISGRSGPDEVYRAGGSEAMSDVTASEACREVRCQNVSTL
jgi:hypothetical protein